MFKHGNIILGFHGSEGKIVLKEKKRKKTFILNPDGLKVFPVFLLVVKWGRGDLPED